MSDIAREAQGKWHGIFNAIGIKVGDGTHTKCPACGGKDRFRFDDKEGRGTYFCNQCGSGDGFGLMQKVLGIEFKDAAKEVEGVIGKVTKRNNQPNEPRISKEKLRKIFTESKPATSQNLVGKYLKSRGLEKLPEGLRYHPKCYEPESKKEHPAMLAVFMSPDNEALTMHRTYLKSNGAKADIEKQKKILPGLKKLTGGAIRLFTPKDGIMGIAEGIETAIAATEMSGISTWSAVSSTLLAAFEPPDDIKHLHIFADNDDNFAGQKAAYDLAHKIKLKRDIEVIVHIPNIPDTDFVDELNERHREVG